MSRSLRSSLLESVSFLILLGLMAGAVGGLGLGFIQSKASSSSTTSTAK